LEAGLRSKDAFVMRRSQIRLASSRGLSPPEMALSPGCGSQTVSNAIHAFHERGLDALVAGSSHPKRVLVAFGQERAEALREMLHRSPREFGYETSLCTLQMAAEVAFEEGLTQRRVSGEIVRATLVRLLGVRWMRVKRWITFPTPATKEEKTTRPTDGGGCSQPRNLGGGFPGRVLVESDSLASLEHLERGRNAPSPAAAVGRQRGPRA
jgi:transposase